MGLFKNLLTGGGGGSSSGAMTVPQFNQWVERLKQFRKNATRGAMQHLGKYIRTQHRDRLKAHVGPDGQPWKPTFFAPRPRIGDRVPMIVSRGALPTIGPKTRLQSARTGSYPAVVVETIQTVAGRRRAVAFRERYGPPFKPDKALIRTAGKHKATRIRDFLTKPSSGSVRVSATSLEYGYTRGTKWIEALHGGGQFREGSKRNAFRSMVRLFRGAAKVPPRPIVGLNAVNVQYIEQYMADRYQQFANEEA
jgi:hypothetical protein